MEGNRLERDRSVESSHPNSWVGILLTTSLPIGVLFMVFIGASDTAAQNRDFRETGGFDIESLSETQYSIQLRRSVGFADGFFGKSHKEIVTNALELIRRDNCDITIKQDLESQAKYPRFIATIDNCR